MDRIIKPMERVDEDRVQSLERVEALVIGQRHVMIWVMKNQAPVDGRNEGSQIIRSYGWDPETGEYDFDAGIGQRPSTRDHIDSFLRSQGTDRLEPADFRYLEMHMGLLMPDKPVSSNSNRAGERASL